MKFDAPDLDAAHNIMAWVGRACDRGGVLPFVHDRDGPDAIYRIWAAETDLTKLGNVPEDNGLQYKPFRLPPTGTEIAIFDEGQVLSECVYQTVTQALYGDVRV